MVQEDMRGNLFKSKYSIFILLFLIGFIVHFKSFQMVPYGDDWTFIYDYSAHVPKSMHVNTNYPGLLSFLTPYGPAILTIGLVYKFFGNTYFIYYLIPLLLKVLIAFFLYLTLEVISFGLKQNNRFTNVLAALLFLVGFTGIQAIDWSMNMNVFVAIFVFVVGLYFQSKYLVNQYLWDLIASFLLEVLSILIAPTRFTPLIVILPIIDLVVLIYRGFRQGKIILLKNIVFLTLTYIFLQIGIFGEPGQMNNSSLIGPFLSIVLSNPIHAFLIFMHWVGITIIPIYPASGLFITAIAGILFIALLFFLYIKSRNRWIIIGGLLYFIPLFLMWLSSPTTYLEDSASRHLLVPFFALCLLAGVIFMLKNKVTSILKFLFIPLILIHIFSVYKVYSSWLSIGRSKDFIIPVQEKIIRHFSSPITGRKFIFLDFDDGTFQQSVEFGIGYRVAVFTGTKGLDLFPKPISKKSVLLEEVKKEIDYNQSKEDVIKNIYAFQLRKGIFVDITDIFQKELSKEI